MKLKYLIEFYAIVLEMEKIVINDLCYQMDERNFFKSSCQMYVSSLGNCKDLLLQETVKSSSRLVRVEKLRGIKNCQSGNWKLVEVFVNVVTLKFCQVHLRTYSP